METEGSRSVENPVRYPLDQLLLIHLLSGRGALIHAAGTILEDKGYIFAGTSGSGKSTLAGLMSERQGYSLLSDDRVVAGEESGELTVYGTPWPGEAGMAENRKAPLERIFILEHGRVNRIRELSAPEILEKLLPAVSVPWYHQVSLSGTLDFLNTLIQRTPVCVMEFNPDEGAVRHLEEYLSA
jgi:hypothetical protein